MKTLLTTSALLLLTSCAALSAGSSERPNSYQDMQTDQQRTTKDPYNYLDPAIGAKPPKPADPPKLCVKTCGAGERCDASGPVERCVEDTRAKP